MTEQKYHSKNEKKAQVKSKQAYDLAKQIHFETIDSTNTWAKMHVDQWASQGVTLITASAQTAGRGRFKREWISPPHCNIYATFCFWLDPQRTDIGHIPQLLALAAAKTIEREGFSPRIKWPNDLLLQGKKVGGILCETILENDQRGVVCGIGLNVNMPKEILNQIDRPATSLLVEREETFEVAPLLERLQQIFLADLAQFILTGFTPFFPLFQERSVFKKGKKVYFHDNQNVIEAQFKDLHPDGSVELYFSNGSTKIFYAGEFIEHN